MSRIFHKMRGLITPIEIVGSIAGDVSSAAGTVHNMGSFDVGSSDSSKKCALAITTEDVSSHLITGVTLGGVALAEKIAQQHFAGPFYINAAIWGGDIASKSGSQAIVVTMAGTTDSVGVSGVSVHEMNSLTPYDTAVNTMGGINQLVFSSFSGDNGGLLIGCGAIGDRTFTAIWSNMTEKADLQTGAGSDDHRHTSAWDITGRVSSTETITFSATGQGAGVVASFR